MILIIRISGLVDVNGDEKEALHRLRMRRKYSAVLIKPTPENMSLLIKLRNLIAYGEIDKKTLTELIAKRGMAVDKSKKIDAEKVAEKLSESSLSELGLKPFFRLHPPRGGIDAKKHFGVKKGVLGDNGKGINDLVRRML